MGNYDQNSAASLALLLIKQSQFRNNAADEFGGALHFARASGLQQPLEDLNFDSNSASAGGAIYLEELNTTNANVNPTECHRCIFKLNTARSYGPKFGTDIKGIGSSSSSRRSNTEAPVPFWGGVPIGDKLAVRVVDQLGQLVGDRRNGDGVECKLMPPPELEVISGKVVEFSDQGKASFNSLALAGSVDTTYVLP